MNNQTAELLKTLAGKLGTTSELLWNILLKQAHISATIQLLQTILVILFALILYKKHLKFSKETEKDNSIYYNNEGIVICMIISSIICGILLIVVFICLSDIFNGYFNPQYWALEKILDTMRSSK